MRKKTTTEPWENLPSLVDLPTPQQIAALRDSAKALRLGEPYRLLCSLRNSGPACLDHQRPWL